MNQTSQKRLIVGIIVSLALLVPTVAVAAVIKLSSSDSAPPEQVTSPTVSQPAPEPQPQPTPTPEPEPEPEAEEPEEPEEPAEEPEAPTAPPPPPPPPVQLPRDDMTTMMIKLGVDPTTCLSSQDYLSFRIFAPAKALVCDYSETQVTPIGHLHNDYIEKVVLVSLKGVDGLSQALIMRTVGLRCSEFDDWAFKTLQDDDLYVIVYLSTVENFPFYHSVIADELIIRLRQEMQAKLNQTYNFQPIEPCS